MSYSDGSTSIDSSTCEGQWSEADSWTMLIKLNREFLLGDYNCSPYYNGPIENETTILLPDLLKMHDYGCLSFESQPALTRGPEKNDEVCCGCGGADAFWHCKQKAFLSFLIPKKMHIEPGILDKFCKSLGGNDQFYSSILRYDGMCKNECCVKAPTIQSNFPGEDNWETHLRSYGPTRKALMKKELSPRQHIDLWCTRPLFIFDGQAQDVVIEAEPLIIHLLAKDWEPVSLAGLVAKIAEESGLEREFVEIAGDSDEEASDEEGSDKEGSDEEGSDEEDSATSTHGGEGGDEKATAGVDGKQ